jgi:hypothetical protein
MDVSGNAAFPEEDDGSDEFAAFTSGTGSSAQANGTRNTGVHDGGESPSARPRVSAVAFASAPGYRDQIGLPENVIKVFFSALLPQYSSPHAPPPPPPSSPLRRSHHRILLFHLLILHYHHTFSNHHATRHQVAYWAKKKKKQPPEKASFHVPLDNVFTVAAVREGIARVVSQPHPLAAPWLG